MADYGGILGGMQDPWRWQQLFDHLKSRGIDIDPSQTYGAQNRTTKFGTPSLHDTVDQYGRQQARAVDVNARDNPDNTSTNYLPSFDVLYGTPEMVDKANQPSRVITRDIGTEAADKFNMTWGGNFRSRSPDRMHFQLNPDVPGPDGSTVLRYGTQQPQVAGAGGGPAPLAGNPMNLAGRIFGPTAGNFFAGLQTNPMLLAGLTGWGWGKPEAGGQLADVSLRDIRAGQGLNLRERELQEHTRAALVNEQLARAGLDLRTGEFGLRQQEFGQKQQEFQREQEIYQNRKAAFDKMFPGGVPSDHPGLRGLSEATKLGLAGLGPELAMPLIAKWQMGDDEQKRAIENSVQELMAYKRMATAGRTGTPAQAAPAAPGVAPTAPPTSQAAPSYPLAGPPLPELPPELQPPRPDMSGAVPPVAGPTSTPVPPYLPPIGPPTQTPVPPGTYQQQTPVPLRLPPIGGPPPAPAAAPPATPPAPAPAPAAPQGAPQYPQRKVFAPQPMVPFMGDMLTIPEAETMAQFMDARKMNTTELRASITRAAAAEQAAQVTYATEQAKQEQAKPQARAKLSGLVENMDAMNALATRIRNDKALPDITGTKASWRRDPELLRIGGPGGIPLNPYRWFGGSTAGEPGRDLEDAITTLVHSVGKGALSALKAETQTGASGLGGMNEGELKLIEGDLADLENTTTSTEQYKQKVDRIITHVNRVRARMLGAYEETYNEKFTEPSGRAKEPEYPTEGPAAKTKRPPAKRGVGRMIQEIRDPKTGEMRPAYWTGDGYEFRDE